MYIVAGELKGRKLVSPSDKRVRPTAGKTKQAIFNMLQWVIQDAVVADLFCGCGNLGIEAISRGAAKCYFSDASRDSIRLTSENIEKCGIQDKSILMTGDYKKNISLINEQADIIFLDPPYSKGYMEKAFEAIREKELLSQGGIIVAEHGKNEELPDILSGYKKFKEKKYGITIISLYKENIE